MTDLLNNRIVGVGALIVFFAFVFTIASRILQVGDISPNDPFYPLISPLTSISGDVVWLLVGGLFILLAILSKYFDIGGGGF